MMAGVPCRKEQIITQNQDRLNEILEPFGINLVEKSGVLFPYYDGCAMITTNPGYPQSREYTLIGTPSVEKIRIGINLTTDVIGFKRNISADSYRIMLRPQEIYSEKADKVYDLGYSRPNFSLCTRGMLDPLYNEVRIIQRRKNQSYEPNYAKGCYNAVDNSLIMTIMFMNRRAILVEKDKVKVAKRIVPYFNEETAEYNEIPYSGYDELETVLESAILNLISQISTYLNIGEELPFQYMVVKKFLIDEVRRAIGYLKEKDSVKGVEKKSPQLFKKTDEVN